MIYRQDTKTVLYRSKMNPVSKRNFAIFPVLDWIATLTAHVPNKGEQLVRYYGYYSNVSRGKRKKLGPEKSREIVEVAAAPVTKELKKRWSYFIRKVYETDPLTCPKCQGEMWFDKLTTLRKPEGRIISFVDQPGVIQKILEHLASGDRNVLLKHATENLRIPSATQCSPASRCEGGHQRGWIGLGLSFGAGGYPNGAVRSI